MGGRPQIVGLLAVAVVVWCASLVAALPAAAEINFPIPGLFTKEKPVTPNRYVRPTLPRRNPTRVTAHVSASAVSPPQAKDSEAAAAVGAISFANVSLVLPRAPERPRRTAQALAVTSPSSDTGPAETEPQRPDTMSTAAAADEPVVASVESSAAEAKNNAAAEAAVAAGATAEMESANGKSTGTEPSDAADVSEDAPAPAETEDARDAKATAAPTTAAALPKHDASVVLDVTPPPEDPSPAKDETSKKDATETASPTLTSPSAPAEAGEPENADAGSAASDTDTDAAADGNSEVAKGSGDASQEIEEAAAPAPPPAHPVVAQVREKLEDPGLSKTVAASDLKALKAFYGVYEGPPLWVSEDGFTAKARELIAEMGKADEWGLKASSYEVSGTDDRPATPDASAEKELQLSVTLLRYARQAQIGRLSPRNVSKLFDQHPSLRDPETVLKEIAAADEPSVYLLTLHPQHEQFNRLRKALARARENAELTGRDPSTDRDVQLITINMERWRWMPRSLGNYHVWSNVPEFYVRVKKGDQTIYQEKTIVGQYKYATPLFSARMQNIVFHPNWTVPPTIVTEDIAPKLQARGGGGFFNNSKEATLRRYGLKASFKGEPINADTVDWNSVNIHTYTFTQDPGPANVLGMFKFNFPNKHAIYMHDTVQRELFAQTNRTLSHGCIRVNQPDQFATLLLGQDKGWTAGQVQNLVAQNETKVVSLNRPVPVHLTYFTTAVDEYGTLNRFGDIYGIDNIMAPMLFSNPASFGAPASASLFELDSDTQTRPRRRNGGGVDDFISGLFGN